MIDTSIFKNTNDDNLLYEPDGTMVLPNGQRVSLNDYQTHLNNNTLICGASGSSKTRNFIIPNILQGVGSYIVTDPKGNLYKKYKNYMQHKAYNVLRLSFIYPNQSIHYNPLHYLKNTQDIQKLIHSLINNDKNQNLPDPFWNEMSTFLLGSIIGYLFEIKDEHPEMYNIPCVIELLRNCGRPDSSSKNCKYAMLLKKHEIDYPDSWAVKQYQNVSQAPNKTYDTVVSNTLSKFSIYDTIELQEMLLYDEIDFVSIGQKPTILFVEISDTDKSMQPLINTFFSQAFNQLCEYADNRKDSRVPCPVRFFLDDFPTTNIDNFEVVISNIRSRKISATIVIQSLAQLNANYGDNASTILDNCDTLIFMGTNSPETAQMIALRANKTMDTILHMPLDHSWIFRRGNKPIFCKNFELESYINENYQLLRTLENIEKEK